MVAAGPDADMVHFAVLIAPPSVKLREVLARQSELIGLAEGGDADAVARNVEISQRAIDAVFASPDDAAARKAALKKIAAAYPAKFPEAAPEAIDRAKRAVLEAAGSGVGVSLDARRGGGRRCAPCARAARRKGRWRYP